MLEVEHVSKKFKDHQVLVDVNLKVNQGDVVVILGPSGSGKTTFLRCLNHLEKADTGHLTLGGKEYDLSKLSKKEILEIRQKTAFVFQHYNLFANKTALENILEGLVVARKIPKEEAIQRAESALEKVGLLAYKDYYPSQIVRWSAATDRNRACHRSETRCDLAGRADFSTGPRVGWGCLRCHETASPRRSDHGCRNA